MSVKLRSNGERVPAGRPFWHGQSPGGRTYSAARLSAHHREEPGSGMWLYGANYESGYSSCQWMVAPRDAESEACVLVRATRLCVSEDGRPEFTVPGQVVMDILTPEGISLGTVMAEGQRAAWLGLVRAVDAYFDLRESA